MSPPRPHHPGDDLPAVRLRPVVALCLALLGLALAWAVVDLPATYPGLAPLAREALAESPITNPVTFVLLDLRGYDTLLEVGVLLLAMLGAWSLQPTRWRALAEAPPLRESAMLLTFARLLVPAMILASGHLLLAGTHRAGGAFQAAAVLGAGGVLLLLGGILRAEDLNHPLPRLLAVFGFAFFLAVALAMLPLSGAFLEYPPELAYGLILAIEATLTVSIGVTLALLYAGCAQAQPAAAPGIEGRGDR
jgi:multisubunit Na+/H+ antiporter MnhB subunit